jgi:D-3-phosphoglycerate dehydrogenase
MDVPGVIGNIGTVLGKEGVNIATMQVGRDKRGEKALMVLNVDDDISRKTLTNVTQIDNILWARAVKL